MTGGKILEQIEIDLRDRQNNIKTIYFDVYENSLSRKWLQSLNHLLRHNYHLEKNYCFFGFVHGERRGPLILEQINNSIDIINKANIGYIIDDCFTMENCLTDSPDGDRVVGRNIVQDKFNRLHRYFEDLQGTSGILSPYFFSSSPIVRWHIRQLNLLCHEFESWALSYRKEIEAPEWQRPSQLMCWLQAPRFLLDEEDYELFRIETINRPLGGVFVGVNKAIGKHHWEVFNDEGAGLDELTTTALKNQTEAAGDFDIEWANNVGDYDWQKKKLIRFQRWLIDNGFDPRDKKLTIGHPQIGQVDLLRSFGTKNYQKIWDQLNNYQDVYMIRSSEASATYDYRWDDPDFVNLQISIISKGHH